MGFFWTHFYDTKLREEGKDGQKNNENYSMFQSAHIHTTSPPPPPPP